MRVRGKKWLTVILALALLLGGPAYLPVPVMEAKAAGSGENLIKNPNFAEEDLSMWMDTGAEITVESQEEEICSGVTTYATVSGRTQSYQGFSQDVTDVVEPGKEYEVSYYVRLSEDYENLAANQRQVFFGPYVVVDGETKYLSQAYSGEITGELIKQIPAGEWVQLSGNFRVEDGAGQVVVRFQEESSASMGSYSITGVVMKEVGGQPAAEEPVGEEDIPLLKDAIQAALGEDTIVGMVTHPANNKKEWALLTRHANAITAGNEFKPDCHFGYSNGKCPGTETVTFNGQSLLVPKIDYSRSESFLNGVLKYNEEHPDNFIKVRGHVLVWHAQTPEWFFHEEYDPEKPYVSKEVMDQRLEWYISTLFEHYMGEDSKYKDLFYGWDVVNEACADSATQVYRDDQGGSDQLSDPTHNSKSSWWHIYQSNEYIINAFKYANKYAPADVELYYNDYNDSWPTKVPNICELLRAVKEQEGEPGVGTRIDAFGMQAHYSAQDFNVQNFENAARAYLDIVGKIQLTELDMKASSDYDGTAATRDQEYQKQAVCYRNIFETLKKLDAIDGYEVGGITFWGVTDPTSWLQNASDVGGGSDGLRSQCPLLFDGNYLAKPAFWAFVDPDRISLLRRNTAALKTDDGDDGDGCPYAFSDGDVKASVTPLWNEEELLFHVEVTDKSVDEETDTITVYLDAENRGEDGIRPEKITVLRKDAHASSKTSYEADIRFPVSDGALGKEILFDVVVKNGEQTIAFNDILGSQENSSRNYASAVCRPALTEVHQGKVEVDGEKDEIWDTAETFRLNQSTGDTTASAKVKALWNLKTIYLYAEVTDSEVSASGDALEIYFDQNYARGDVCDSDDKSYRISSANELICFGQEAKEKQVESFVKKTEDGYVIEAAISLPGSLLVIGNRMGFELRLNDADASGKTLGTLSWCDAEGKPEENPASLGTIRLASPGEPKEETDEPEEISGPADEDAEAPSQEGTDGSTGISGMLLLEIIVIAAVIAGLAVWYFRFRGAKKPEDQDVQSTKAVEAKAGEAKPEETKTKEAKPEEVKTDEANLDEAKAKDT